MYVSLPTGRWEHPVATALVYLSTGVGGPTIILNHTRTTAHFETVGNVSSAPTGRDAWPGGNGWLVRPAMGEIVIFDSTLLHGALPSFDTASEKSARLSINVAFWSR